MEMRDRLSPEESKEPHKDSIVVVVAKKPVARGAS